MKQTSDAVTPVLFGTRFSGTELSVVGAFPSTGNSRIKRCSDKENHKLVTHVSK